MMDPIKLEVLKLEFEVMKQIIGGIFGLLTTIIGIVGQVIILKYFSSKRNSKED